VVNHRRGLGACVAAALALASALLAGCGPSSFTEGRSRLPDPFDTVQNTNLAPRFPQQIGQLHAAAKTAQGESFYGSEVAPGTPPVQPAASGEGYDLNFENAAVTTVAKVILGDILGVGYTIDPRVQGTVTISSGRPVKKSDLIFVLENALRMSNVVLIADRDGSYRLIPGGEAQGGGATTLAGHDERGGYGITVVPLRYTSAPTILKLLDSFAIKAGMARADTGHNLILVQGTGPERKTAVDAILSFDVDWMRGQSVGIYPVENAAPEQIIKELGKIMENGAGGLNQSLVTLEPVARLNAVLVVARKSNLLREAAIWIHRLDKANNAGESVHVYRLRYGDAREIARVLGDLFGTGSSQGLSSPVNQIAPGAGTTRTSSGGLGSLSSGFPGTTNNSNSSGPGLSGTTPLNGTGGASGGGGLQLGGLGTGLGTAGLGGGAGGRSALPGQPGAAPGGNAQGQTAVVLPGVRIAADVANNALVIFANQERFKLIEQTLAQLDRPQLQVAIHATIAEVTLNNDLQYGIEYYLQSKSAIFGLTTSSTQAMLSAVLPGGNFLLGPNSNPDVVINALRNITDVKVLSSPSVVVIDNQVATLQVGDQVPVETQSATILTNPNTPLVNSINYINTGVILRVLPRININGNVILDVEQEISNVANNSTAQTLTPTVSQRKVKSAISVASGQTVLLGGLITETQSRGRSGLPVLSEIPGIGDLFASNDRSTVRTELIIFIEPQIIRNSVDAAKIAEELRAKMRGSAEAAFPPGPSLRQDPRFVR
jgi:general secretion pathway protein D